MSIYGDQARVLRPLLVRISLLNKVPIGPTAHRLPSCSLVRVDHWSTQQGGTSWEARGSRVAARNLIALGTGDGGETRFEGSPDAHLGRFTTIKWPDQPSEGSQTRLSF